MINIIALFIVFILFSILGYYIEYINECNTGYCKYHYSFLTKPLPFLQIYGFGAVILWLLTPYLIKYNIIIQFIFIVIALTAFEFLCGYFRKKITGNNSWQYSNGSYIDIKHSIIWGIAGVLLISIFNIFQQYIS